jgi:hypothetical protein
MTHHHYFQQGHVGCLVHFPFATTNLNPEYPHPHLPEWGDHQNGEELSCCMNKFKIAMVAWTYLRQHTFASAARFGARVFLIFFQSMPLKKGCFFKDA